VVLGATVVVQDDAPGSRPSSFKVVGVDEADPFEGLVAFTAPAAAALLGRKVGDTVSFVSGDGSEKRQKLLEVRYD
jgi:transcription elongation factor GreA